MFPITCVGHSWLRCSAVGLRRETWARQGRAQRLHKPCFNVCGRRLSQRRHIDPLLITISLDSEKLFNNRFTNQEFVSSIQTCAAEDSSRLAAIKANAVGDNSK